MASVADSVLEEIKARTELSDLVSSYGIAVRVSGGSAKACCPFHHEKTPSFHINTTRGFYHCFGCGESGDAIKFVQKMEGLGFMEAVKKLAFPLGIKIEETREDPDAGRRKRLYALMAELAAFYHRCLLKAKEAELAREYLKKRELDEKTCEEWQIGYAPNGITTILKWAAKYGYTPEELADAGVIKPPDAPGDRGYHRFGGRLMFSVRDKQGRVVAFSGRQLVEQKHSGKYVNSPETLIFKKSNVLFGFDRAAANIARSPHREAIVCEGQIDTIRLHLNGFPVAVASQGTAFTEEHSKMLKRVCDSIVLAYDDDGAGHKATVKVGGMMLALEVPVRVAHIPDGDDPDSFLRTKGAEAFRRLLDDAESIVAFQVRSERAKEPKAQSIDAVTRVSRAVLATIAQCPSAILRASMVDEAARLLGLPVAALNEELAKVKATARTGAGRRAREVASAAEQPTDNDRQPTISRCVEEGEDAGAVAPPNGTEMAFMAFLMTNERNQDLDGLIGGNLPPKVYGHDFTRRFVEAWRASVVTGEDEVAKMAQAAAAHEREWFGRLLAAGGLVDGSTMDPSDILKDFIRRLWQEALKRRRGRLPAFGDQAADLERIKISADIRQLDMVKWHTVKNMIAYYTQEGGVWI